MINHTKYGIFLILAVIFQIGLCGCKSAHDIRGDFADLSVKVNAVIEVKLILRTEDVVPDKFFLQDTHTYKLYEMTWDEKNIFYYEGLPAGVYRAGFWLAEHKTGKPEFKATGFSDVIVSIPFEKDAKVNVSLGSLRQQCNISSLEVKPGNVTLTPRMLVSKKFGECPPLPAERIQVKDLTKSVIYAKFGAGSAEYYDDNYAILEKRLTDAAFYEKDMAEKYNRVIDRQYRQRGAEAALELINGFLADRYSEHIVVKKAEILYSEGRVTECEQIFDKMYQENPNFPEYFALEGLKAAEQGNTDKAQTMFYKAVSLGSGWARIYDEFARLVLKQENLPTAKLLSDYALQIESNNIKLLETNLEISRKLGDSKRAAKLETAIKQLSQEDRHAKE